MEELNKIRLNNNQLAALYGKSLVDVNAPITKKVMVVVKSKLNEAQHALLMQILGACKLDQTDVSIINTSDKKTVLEQEVKTSDPRYILSFGSGSGTELFSMGNLQGRKYLNAPSLDEMMLDNDSSKQLKRRTWNELKQLFGIN
jgi:hypothetical protein